MSQANFKGKKILLGITGSIAAYKSVFLLRRMKELGAEVKVVMTPTAAKFVQPITFATLSGEDVFIDLIDKDQWNSHVELGLWADVMLIAPLTATTLGKMYAGICDNMILACWLSAKCPIAVAPAMDRDMILHPATVRNLEMLKSWDHHIIDSEYGELASGLIGYGRLADTETIIKYLSEEIFAEKPQPLAGKKILITAGPTYENIDPVRFIGNSSTGKMGIAIADACANRGAEVILVLGPTNLRPANDSIKILHVRSAVEMYDASVSNFPEMNAAFMTAAVSDYRSAEIADQKIKKTDNEEGLTLNLVRNPDIAFTLGQNKKEEQFLCGFALETENALQNAQQKLDKKNFDIIVMNNLSDEGAGFAHNTNKVTIVSKGGEIVDLPLLSKTEVADYIVEYYIKLAKI